MSPDRQTKCWVETEIVGPPSQSPPGRVTVEPMAISSSPMTNGNLATGRSVRTKRPEPIPGRLTPQVATFLRATVFAILSLALVVSFSAALGAAAQEPTSTLPVSLERIREELEKTPARTLKLDVPLQLPVATFKTGVNQRMYVLSLEEQLRKEFTLTTLQRQSADWASKCCGLNLNQLFNSAERALHRRKVRKIRQQIARELAQLEAARTK